MLKAELRTTLYTGVRKSSSDEEEFDTAFAEAVAASEDDSEDERETTETEKPDNAIGDLASVDAASKTENAAPAHEQVKVYALLPLDKAGAALYLGSHRGMHQPKQTLIAARQYGLGRLAEGPGGLDILAYIDPVRNPPQCLTQVFEKMVEAVQQQQRTDPRERQVGSPLPESLDGAIERLASASVVCQLPNIELSPEALRYSDGVLSARPIIASLLSESSLTYLLGSRLFIDSGQYQVKLYPDELLPFLAAKRLAALVKSPEHARRLLANFTWHSTTGECGVYRPLLPLAGWLAVFSTHSRQELLRVEPQAVAFFGDLRNPQVQVTEASNALERAIERLVSAGDSLGRSYYTLTDENYWQAAKPGIEPTLNRLFEKYSADWDARDALLNIAGHARLDVLRDAVLSVHGGDYGKLMDEQLDLHYILSLGREVDLFALGAALRDKADLSETSVAGLVAKLAWKVLDARSIAEIAAEQFRRERSGFSIDWVLTGDVAEEASDVDLYRLTRSLLLRLVNSKVGRELGSERYWADQKFLELVIDLLALVIKRPALDPSRAAKLCLVLSRFVNKHHDVSPDTVKLQAALQANKVVRLEFLRGLIHATDKTAESICRVMGWYHPLCPYVDGDEVELGEPGFSEFLENRKKSAVALPRRPTERRDRELLLEENSKATLRGMLDGLRDASEESALAWVAQWLLRTVQQSHHGECNFTLFEQAAGSEIAQAVREGLSTLWRSRDPTWDEDKPDSTYYITIAGLQGIWLNLGDGARLPVLSEQEVRRAIRYAQFEINGYPKWFWRLVGAHEQVATQELGVILAGAGKGQLSMVKAETLIRRLDEASEGVRHSLARAAWDFVLGHPQPAERISEAALKVAAANSGVIDQATFEAEAWRRMGTAFDEEIPSLGDTPDVMDADAQKARQALDRRIHELRRKRSDAVVWGGYWLWTYPRNLGQRWESWRADKPQSAEGFMLSLAAYLGEDRGREDSGARLKRAAETGSDGLNTLKMLYEWVRSVVREEDDINRKDGRIYSPGERDHAQRLRNALAPAISHAKSEQAYEVLEGLRQQAAGPTAKYLRYLQFMMREEQYAKKPIAQTDYHEFERSFAPRVSEYMDFAMAVETDLLTVKSQIETGDFSLRRFFNSLNFKRIKTHNDGLALEEDFQALLGSELNHAAGGRYAVTLEPILPEMTRRDVLCQSGSLRATVELKMSLRWTLEDYIEALEKQLQGQYMMAPNSKIGFFVVVLQEQRAWKGPDGNRIGFDELLGILKNKAREKEIDDSSVYLRVIGIDAAAKENFRSARSATEAAGAATAPRFADDAGNT
ncbi:hypothetical protein [Thiocapsa roseopersicina]|uniref:hypothetical protein n=1 Tax=Thiocapsa roseopersicina TaxID=1058 RepID=UPI00111378C5|nr:hypothetical protein [Thiocapsa roseopersicina]